jgi:sugar lactone lactonase YvrE
MKIKQILCALAFTSMAATAIAQQAPAGERPQLDPSTLSEAQIAQTQKPQALFKLAAIYKQNGDLERLTWVLRRLIALRPHTGDLKLALAMAYAEEGDKSKTYETLLAMQKQGLGYDLSTNKNFEKVTDTEVWKYVVQGLQANLKPFGEGKVAFTLPQGDHLYESLAFDPQRKQLLVGSVRDGTIQLVGKDGKLQDFIAPNAQNGLWSVYAMATVPEDDALYVASTSSVYFKDFKKDDYGKAGVFKFKLSSGKFVEKYLLAPDGDARTLSSLAAGRGGLVFAADGLRNQIYRLDGRELKLTVQNPQLTSIRGLALDGEGKKLYFADYSLGLFGVDLAAGKGFDLEYDPATLVLGGIDGLYWYQHALVAIENGMMPHRVMRLSLNADGRKITRATPLDAGSPELKLPTYGAIDGDGLYFIANSQKNAYGTYGTPKDDAKLEAVRVFRSDLNFNTGSSEPGGGLPMLPAARSKPGEGVFRNVQGGSSTASAG